MARHWSILVDGVDQFLAFDAAAPSHATSAPEHERGRRNPRAAWRMYAT